MFRFFPFPFPPFLSISTFLRLLVKTIREGAERCHCFDGRQVSGGYVRPGYRKISGAGVPQGRRHVLPRGGLHGPDQVRHSNSSRYIKETEEGNRYNGRKRQKERQKPGRKQAETRHNYCTRKKQQAKDGKGQYCTERKIVFNAILASSL